MMSLTMLTLLTLSLSGCAALKIAGYHKLNVAYAVFVTDVKDAAMKDALEVQAHGLKEYVAKKSKHTSTLLAIVPERMPEDQTEFLSSAGFQVIKKPLPVHPSAIDPVGGQEMIPEFSKIQGNDKRSQFMMAEETIKYWPLSMTEYDRVLMLDADVMVLNEIDELIERPEDLVGVYDHDLDIPGSTVPPVNGGFLLYRPNMKDFEMVKKLTREGRWYGNGWDHSNIGYCYGGTGPTGLLSYLYHKDALTQLKQVGKKEIRDGLNGKQHVEGVRFFAADRTKYDVIMADRLMKDTEGHAAQDIADGITAVHFTGRCSKPWHCEGSGGDKLGKVCKTMHLLWFEMRKSLEYDQKRPVVDKVCRGSKYLPMKTAERRDPAFSVIQ